MLRCGRWLARRRCRIARRCRITRRCRRIARRSRIARRRRAARRCIGRRRRWRHRARRRRGIRWRFVRLLLRAADHHERHSQQCKYRSHESLLPGFTRGVGTLRWDVTLGSLSSDHRRVRCAAPANTTASSRSGRLHANGAATRRFPCAPRDDSSLRHPQSSFARRYSLAAARVGAAAGKSLNTLAMASALTGFTRCKSNPASRERAMSSR